MSAPPSTLRLSQTQQLNLYYRAVIKALDPKTREEIFGMLGGLKANTKSDMICHIISRCRLHPATVLGRAFKKLVTETELKFLLNMLDIMRKEYKYGIGQQEDIEVELSDEYEPERLVFNNSQDR